MKSNFIILKGVGHPDSITNSLADVAINSLQNFNEENGYNIYGDFSNSYLKGGKFPTFTVGGYMPFDFREYSKSLRYEIFNYIKNDIVKHFKDIFPEPTINIKFDLNLEPSNIKYFLESNLNVESSSLYIPLGLSKLEEELLSLKIYISALSSTGVDGVGRDFIIRLFNERLIIEQTFSYANEENVETYKEIVENFIKNNNLLSSKEVIINNDYSINGNIKWSRYGSTIFHNSSSTVGNGNDWYGLRTSTRPILDCVYGKSSNHPTKHNLESSEMLNYTDRDDVSGIILDSVIGMPLGEYKVTLI